MTFNRVDVVYFTKINYGEYDGNINMGNRSQQ